MAEQTETNLDVGAILNAMSDEPYKEYWSTLGTFIHAFSLTEARLLSLLRHLARIEPLIGGAMLSGVRVDAGKDYINRILEATGKTEIKQRLERPFAQLGVVNGVRNHIIHWGARHDGKGGLLVSNAFQNPAESRLNEFRVSSDDVKHMTADLFRISALLLLEELPVFPPEILSDRFLRGPWSYKPPPPSPPGTRTQRRARAQRRQPRASRE